MSHLASARAYLGRAKLPADTPLVELAGDASDRRYVRFRTPNAETRLLLVHREPFDAERLPFINVAQLFGEIPVAVPAILGVAGDLGILELEDLGDTTLESRLLVSDRDTRRAHYRRAAELIALIQERGRVLASSRFVPYGLAFDREKLGEELDFFVEHFVIGHRKTTLTDDEREELANELQRLTVTLAAEPRVLCHRDFHSRNLMLRHDELYVIDFQDARLGPDTYDLVSLLRDAYVDVDEALADDALGHYFDALGLSEPPDFRTRYDRMAIQRHLKALGTFGYQAETMGTTRYADAVPRTLTYLRQVLGRNDDAERLHVLLARHIPEVA
jgi:aminoglycoside/choline kinase family phosphotransferase